MKRLLLLITICISSVSFGQYTSIPDPSFEQKLISAGHDDVVDGQVLTANISSITYLDLNFDFEFQNPPMPPISNLTGINDFISLQYLNLSNNNIDSLIINNIDPLTSTFSLNDLDCSGNPLTFLSVINCVNLQYLDIRSTPLSHIDLSNNVNLKSLSFGGSYYDEMNNEWLFPSMTTIDLSNNYLLMDVDYSGGLLEYIDLSNLIGFSDIGLYDCYALECINLANGTNGVNWDGDVIWGGVGVDAQDCIDLGLPPPPPLCIQVDDVNIANTLWVGNFDIYHPNYTFSTDCGDCSGTSNLTELNSNQPKELIKIVNLLGQEVEYAPNTVLIYQYSDGTSEKVYTIED